MVACAFAVWATGVFELSFCAEGKGAGCAASASENVPAVRKPSALSAASAASKSNSSCCVSRGGFFRGETIPSISSSVARGGVGATLRDGTDVDVVGDGKAGASVADGMRFSSSTVNPDCAASCYARSVAKQGNQRTRSLILQV